MAAWVFDRPISWRETWVLLIMGFGLHIFRALFLRFMRFLSSQIVKQEDSSYENAHMRVSIHPRSRYSQWKKRWTDKLHGSHNSRILVGVQDNFKYVLLFSRVFLSIISTICNFIVITIFFIGIEQRSMSLAMGVLNIVAGVLLSLNFILRSFLDRDFANQSTLDMLLSTNDLVDALTMPSIFASGVGLVSYGNLNYIRIHFMKQDIKRILFGKKATRSRNLQSTPDLHKYLILFFVDIFALVLILACSMVLLERLFEQTGSAPLVTDPNVGIPWNYVTSYYFSVVTIATVGYGDMSPGTYLGRLVVMLMITTFLYYMGNKLASLIPVLGASASFGEKPFKENLANKHVIVTGTIRADDLAMFLKTFYSDYALESARVVLLAESLSMERSDYARILQNAWYDGRVQFVKGNPTNRDDYRRAKLKAAAAVFVFSHPDHPDPIQADIFHANVISGVRSVAPWVPIFAMFLRDEVAQFLEDSLFKSAGIPGNQEMDRAKATADQGFSLEKIVPKRLMECFRAMRPMPESSGRLGGCGELVGSQYLMTGLLSQNVRVPGCYTVIAGLVNSVYAPMPSLEDGFAFVDPALLRAAWRREYLRGAESSFHLWRVPEVVSTPVAYERLLKSAFKKLMVIVLARFRSGARASHDEVAESHAEDASVDDTRMEMLRMGSLVKGGDFLLIIAHPDHAKLLDSRTEAFVQELGQSVNAAVDAAAAASMSTVSSFPAYRSSPRKHFQKSLKFVDLLHASKGDDATAAARESVSIASTIFDKTGLKGHIVIVAESQSETFLIYRLISLLLRNLVHERGAEDTIVVLIPGLSRTRARLLSALSPNVKVLEGSADNLEDLYSTGVESASAFLAIGLGTHYFPNGSDAFCVRQTLKRTFRSCTIYNGSILLRPNANVFFCTNLGESRELISVAQAYPRRMGVRLGHTARGLDYASDGEGDMEQHKANDVPREPFSKSEFGNVEDPTPRHVMSGKAFQMAGVVPLEDVMGVVENVKDDFAALKGKNLFIREIDPMIAHRNYAGGELVSSGILASLLCREFHIPGISEYVMRLAGVYDDELASPLQSLTVPEGFDGKSFRELFDALIDVGVIPIALVRSGLVPVFEGLEPGNTMPYIYTNPMPDTSLSKFDGVIVLRYIDQMPDLASFYAEDSDLKDHVQMVGRTENVGSRTATSPAQADPEARVERMDEEDVLQDEPHKVQEYEKDADEVNHRLEPAFVPEATPVSCQKSPVVASEGDVDGVELHHQNGSYEIPDVAYPSNSAAAAGFPTPEQAIPDAVNVSERQPSMPAESIEPAFRADDHVLSKDPNDVHEPESAAPATRPESPVAAATLAGRASVQFHLA
ncbi:Potassium channel subfamily T member 1 [Porphyridium purpureum]|uniref:Potassium channel subfamily T member 1 n=1 Tax=Porphyridium purpureum TaxID=35688 RepID=A0A5J4YLZ4_PORPP|nr:Potassium channel subfamily T member 1 [Porphyridium purpureum]|eukprot:POR3277..scf295_9